MSTPAADTRPDLYLAGAAYTIGEHRHRLDDLDAVLPGVRASLAQAGVQWYHTTSRAAVDLARDSLEQTMKAVDAIPRAEIRHLIYATNTAWDNDYSNVTALGDLVRGLGLVNAYPMGVFLSYCANLQLSLRLASAAIHSGQADHVAVVCTDKTDPAGDRLVHPRLSVHTDAAASFVLTRHRLPGALRLRNTVLNLDTDLARIDPDEQFMQYLDGVSEGVVQVVGDTLGELSMGIGDLRMMLPNNYNTMVTRIIGDLAGFRREQVYTDNIGRIAHALAADGVINLVDWLATGAADTGDHVLLLGTGPSQWGCAVAEVVE